MIFQTQRLARLSTFLVLAMQMLWLAPATAWAQAVQTDLSIPDKPLFSSYSASPIVMLDVSRDHQLFYKAYNDYSDLNGNGVLETTETTYNNGFLYYGYFDSTKCYSYSSGNKKFSPQPGGGTDVPTDCSGNWSGNFLNWVSMSRLDIMRKVLFGGLRQTSADTATGTVLERAAIPTDAHSWVKYYGGSDIGHYTPFSTATSFCNTTYATSDQSQNTTALPVIRRAPGDWSKKWTSNELKQCYWKADYSTTFDPDRPSSDYEFVVRVDACVSTNLGKENCKSYDGGTNYKPVGLLQKYGESTIVQSVKTPPKIYFGLMTGTFAKNISGGVLRKNAKLALANSVDNSGALTPANDEINAATGQFRDIDGIIKTLSKLRIFGYNYSSGLYFNGPAGDSDSCNYQQTGIVHSGGQFAQGKPATEGNCASWGNPMSEIYIESLRYLAGKSATNAFLYSTGPDTKVELPAPATWTDPLNSKNYCSPLNILMFNASVSSFDNDQAIAPFAQLAGSPDLANWTNQVGTGEGITEGQSVFVGRTDTTSTTDGICTAKAITAGGLSAISGICPESPSLYGSYFMAGAAYFAHTNKIRGPIAGAADSSTPYTVNTYAVQMATNVPRIKIPGTNVVIQPAYFLQYGNNGTGSIVDFRVLSAPTATGGKFEVLWEDSNQGGDHDQDVKGTIEYAVSGTTLTITTDVTNASTAHAQGFGYTVSGTDKDGPHFHSGFSKDGSNFTYTDPTNVAISVPAGTTRAALDAAHINTSGGCNACVPEDPPTTATYAIRAAASSVISLQDPMYYAAKWGGFSTASGSTPATVSSWDSKNNSTGEPASDGLPDNYFYVNNPGVLEAALERAFSGISNTTSGSAVAASTSSLQTGTHVYQAIFNPKTWVGDLLDYTINPSTLVLTKNWSAREKIATQAASDRNIFTSKTDRTAVSFTWSNISSDQQTTLGSEDKLNYIRGDGTNEGDTSDKFRWRDSKLGDIIDSNPVYVGKPSGQYTSVNRFLTAYVNGEGYMSWRTTNLSRTAMIYVGANDGMLHGFKADGEHAGEESFAYIPSQVYPNIATLSNQNYAENHKYSVNGSPEVAEIGWGTGADATWKTVLVSGLRKGGKGLFALDVTAPDSFSASNVLWEFRNSDDSAGDLGYVYGTPVIAKMANGKWMAIFGNGYNSTNGKAVLYLVEIEKATATAWSSNATTGNYKKIILESGPSNGLGPVTPFDIDLNGVPDALYAGDLKGNLWKIDVSSDDPANWAAALSGTALAVAKTSATPLTGCTANTRRPITNPPAVTWHPNSIEQAMVYFGSGKYIESSDVSTDTCDAFYGVWDNNSQTNSGRTDFVSQTIQTDATGERTIQSESPISAWGTHTAGNSTYTGWVQDLPLRERQTGAISVLGGMVFYNTFLPNTNLCDCGGTGYLMGVSYINGGKASPFLNDDDTVKTDVVGLQVGGALGGSTILTSGSAGTALALSNTTKGSGATDPGTGGGDGGIDQDCKDGLGSCQKLNSKALSGTRISWREVIQK